MLTKLQKCKLAILFKKYDLDQNGFVERADYEQTIKNLAQTYNLGPDSREFSTLYREHIDIWEFLRNIADRNTDDQINQQEFIAAYSVLLGNKQDFMRLQWVFAESVIMLTDQDGDGKLSEKEYVINALCFNITEKAAQEAFRHQDRNGDGYLTKDEILKNMEEFFYSADPNAPGSWLIGPF